MRLQETQPQAPGPPSHGTQLSWLGPRSSPVVGRQKQEPGWPKGVTAHAVIRPPGPGNLHLPQDGQPSRPPLRGPVFGGPGLRRPPHFRGLAKDITAPQSHQQSNREGTSGLFGGAKWASATQEGVGRASRGHKPLAPHPGHPGHGSSPAGTPTMSSARWPEKAHWPALPEGAGEATGASGVATAGMGDGGRSHRL